MKHMKTIILSLKEKVEDMKFKYKELDWYSDVSGTPTFSLSMEIEYKGWTRSLQLRSTGNTKEIVLEDFRTQIAEAVRTLRKKVRDEDLFNKIANELLSEPIIDKRIIFGEVVS